MPKTKSIDIMDIRQAVKNGLLRTYVAKGMYNGEYYERVIYLKDMDSEEVVQIGVVHDGN